VTDLQVFRVLAEALALGFLVGAERYRGRPPGEHKAAGVRTFTIFGLLGGVCGVLQEPAATAVAFLGLTTLVALGYYRSSPDQPGLTSEVAALLVFWIGFLLSFHELPAIALGIVLTVFLASKRPLHYVVREKISEAEFDATLRFLVVVLVIYPVMPDRAFGPFGAFNPQRIWGLAILVSAIGYAGYFLVRWLGQKRGLRVAALVGGLVSTTAVTMDLAHRARQQPGQARFFGTVAVFAVATQGPRLLLILWAVESRLAARLLLPLLTLAAAALIASLVMTRRLDPTQDEGFQLENPFSLGPALKFGSLFVVILFGVRVADHFLGQSGTLLATAISGAGSVSAAVLSVADLVSGADFPVDLAAWGVLGAIGTAILAKIAVAGLQGTRPFAAWLTGGLLTAFSAALAALYLQELLG
jgi:uncharacterized membrane protein (DUF4010 family)